MRAAVLALLVAACGSDDVAMVPEDVGGCDGLVEKVPLEPGVHVPIGTPITWSTNPPVTGAHFPIWAAWDRHYTQLERGYYVHNLEHGGVVLLYNCPNGCQDVVDNLLAVVHDASPDASCSGAVRHRLIVASDPLMPTQVAAVAWGQVYTATCFDPYVASFIRTRYRKGPEDTCSDGSPMNGALIP